MSGIHWIKIRTDMFCDEKIRLIEHLSPDNADSILVIWLKLLTLAGQKNANGEIFINDEMAYTDETLAAIFNRKVNTVRLALRTFEKFRMVEIDKDQTIIISNWGKHQNVEGLDKIRQQNLERKRKQRRHLLEQRLLSRDGHVTLRDVSRSEGVTERDQIENRKENKKENRQLPPTVPQGTDADLIANASEAKDWLNQLFGRKRAWSYEEDALLSTLLPISREDQELISWGYSLSRDSEGWALIDGKRITKPKQSLLVLLREFSSELDKWRSARKTIGLKGLHNKKVDDVDLSSEQIAAARKIYGLDVPLPKKWGQLSPSVQAEILAEIATKCCSDGWTPARKQAAYEEFGEAITFPLMFSQLPVEYQRRIDERIRRKGSTDEKETAE